MSIWLLLVAPRRASRARDVKDLPDHLGLRLFSGAGAGASGPLGLEVCLG